MTLALEETQSDLQSAAVEHLQVRHRFVCNLAAEPEKVLKCLSYADIVARDALANQHHLSKQP